MALAPEEKQRRKRQRMIEKAKQYRVSKYKAIVAKVFQQMVRAEIGARPAEVTPAVVNGKITGVHRKAGQCVCITCGKVLPWKNPGGGVLDTGHCIPSRNNAILFEEDGVAPQCVSCNRDRSGAEPEFRLWVAAVRGPEVLDWLDRLKHTARQFTLEELVDLKLAYSARLKAAEERMSGETK